MLEVGDGSSHEALVVDLGHPVESALELRYPRFVGREVGILWW